VAFFTDFSSVMTPFLFDLDSAEYMEFMKTNTYKYLVVSVVISLLGCGGSSTNPNELDRYAVNSYRELEGGSESLTGTWLYLESSDMRIEYWFYDTGEYIDVIRKNRATISVVQTDERSAVMHCIDDNFEEVFHSINGSNIWFDLQITSFVGTVVNNSLIVGELVSGIIPNQIDVRSSEASLIKISNDPSIMTNSQSFGDLSTYVDGLDIQVNHDIQCFSESVSDSEAFFDNVLTSSRLTKLKFSDLDERLSSLSEFDTYPVYPSHLSLGLYTGFDSSDPSNSDVRLLGREGFLFDTDSEDSRSSSSVAFSNNSINHIEGEVTANSYGSNAVFSFDLLLPEELIGN